MYCLPEAKPYCLAKVEAKLYCLPKVEATLYCLPGVLNPIGRLEVQIRLLGACMANEAAHQQDTAPSEESRGRLGMNWGRRGGGGEGGVEGGGDDDLRVVRGRTGVGAHTHMTATGVPRGS